MHRLVESSVGCIMHHTLFSEISLASSLHSINDRIEYRAMKTCQCIGRSLSYQCGSTIWWPVWPCFLLQPLCSDSHTGFYTTAWKMNCHSRQSEVTSGDKFGANALSGFFRIQSGKRVDPSFLFLSSISSIFLLFWLFPVSLSPCLSLLFFPFLQTALESRVCD